MSARKYREMPLRHVRIFGVFGGRGE